MQRCLILDEDGENLVRLRNDGTLIIKELMSFYRRGISSCYYKISKPAHQREYFLYGAISELPLLEGHIFTNVTGVLYVHDYYY